MPQRCTEPGGMATAETGEPRPNDGIHRLVKALDAQIADALAAVGAETVHRDRIIGGARPPPP